MTYEGWSELTDTEKIQDALNWFGIDASPDDCDICENGAVYYGLTCILEKGSANVIRN